MTVQLFMFLFTIGSTVSSLITQSIKKGFPEYSTNFIALVDAGCVGILGTVIAYVLMEIPFDAKNVACIFLMAVCIWVGSMVGYDKVKQTISQIKE